MQISFTKMHGLGNDFVMIDLISQRFKLRSKHVRRLADRRRGVGCDQVLVVEPPGSPDVDFRYRIYNADGSEAEQCGNGARCLAHFVRDRRLTGKTRISVETLKGIMHLELMDNGQVAVDMGPPQLEPAAIPFEAARREVVYPLQLDDRELEISAVSMGNPHAVTVVEDAERTPVVTLGPAIEGHRDFPERVNAGFMQVVSPGEVSLRVYERGVGETQACGSGACAAVVAGRLRGLLDESVTVHLRGGDLRISWAGDNHPVIMTGPATTVFEGRIRL